MNDILDNLVNCMDQDSTDSSDTNDSDPQLAKDKVNNNLMARMDGELNIRKSNKKRQRDFLPPFSNDVGDNYAPFHSKEKKIRNFSNK
jgi:hypothetical protein